MGRNKRKTPDNSTKTQKGKIELAVAKIGLLGTIITGLLGLIGAYLGYAAIRNQIEIPIRATETASLILTQVESMSQFTQTVTLTIQATTFVTPVQTEFSTPTAAAPVNTTEVQSTSKTITVTIYCTDTPMSLSIINDKDEPILFITCVNETREQTIHLPPGNYSYEYTYYQFDTQCLQVSCQDPLKPIETNSGDFVAFDGSIILDSRELQIINSP